MTHRDPPKTAYLRNRPYLIIDFAKSPRLTKGHNRVRTEKSGWMTDPGNLSVAENPRIVDRISDKMLAAAGVVIDLLENKVVRNALDDNAETVLSHFTAKYADIISQGRDQWMRQAMNEHTDFASFARTVRR